MKGNHLKQLQDVQKPSLILQNIANTPDRTPPAKRLLGLDRAQLIDGFTNDVNNTPQPRISFAEVKQPMCRFSL